MNIPTKQKQTHRHSEQTEFKEGERTRSLGLAD